MRCDFEIPGFTGFYDGLWGQSDNEYNEITNLQYSDHPDIRSFNHIDDWGFRANYREEVAQLFAESYFEIMKDVFGTEIELVGSYVRSPKEYNFTTDKIYAIVDIPDYDALVKKLSSIASDPKYRTQLAKVIKDNHSSRDGFWSFMSNDIEDWFGLIVDPDNSHYISYFVGYVLHVLYPNEIEGLNEAVYYYVSEDTDLHCVEPETDEAKEEYELYEKYGELYTDFAKENPMRHPDPNRPGYYAIDDWEDYKERFMEVAEKYEEEQERQAAIDALPIIPGLFDE